MRRSSKWHSARRRCRKSLCTKCSHPSYRKKPFFFIRLESKEKNSAISAWKNSPVSLTGCLKTFTNKIITSPILHQKFKFFYPWKCFYLSFMFMLFGGQILMLRWRNSRSKIDLVSKHLVTRGSHIFSQSWWQTFDLRISFRPASSVCACRSLKCVEPSSHQYFSNLSSRLLVSKTNKIHSKQWIWCFTKKWATFTSPRSGLAFFPLLLLYSAPRV